MIISRWILLRMRNVLGKTCRQNQNTHIFMLNTFFRKSCHLWDNVLKWGRAGQATDDSIIRRMCFAYFITKATHTHTCNMQILLLFHSKCVYAITPQYYVISTLPVSFSLFFLLLSLQFGITVVFRKTIKNVL